MVRGDQYSDESDSDWDSVSQAIPPRPTETTPPITAVVEAEQRPKTVQYNEAVRPNSDSSSRSISSSATAKGPLTFIDRQQSNSPLSIIKLNRTDTSPTLLPKTEVFDEDLPVTVAKVEDIQFHQEQQQQMQVQGQLQQQQIPSSTTIRSPIMSRPKRNMTISRPQSSSDDDEDDDGFDNVAFEGSGRNCSPPSHYKVPAEEGKPPSFQLPLPDETIEIFSYDRINTEFHRVSQRQPRAKADGLGETAFEMASRFCAEIATVIGLPLVILLAVILQLLRFVTAGLLRPLLIGLVMAVSDGLFKPMLAALHNGIIAPLAAFLHNVASAVKTALEPLAGILSLMTEPIGRLLQSCRLIDIQHHHHRPIIRDI